MKLVSLTNKKIHTGKIIEKYLNTKLTNGDPAILLEGDCRLFEEPTGRLLPPEDEEDLGSHIPHSSIDDTIN